MSEGDIGWVGVTNQQRCDWVSESFRIYCITVTYMLTSWCVWDLDYSDWVL